MDGTAWQMADRRWVSGDKELEQGLAASAYCGLVTIDLGAHDPFIWP